MIEITGTLVISLFLYCVNLIFYNRRSDNFLHHIRFCFNFLSTMSVLPSLTTMSVVVTNEFLVSSKSPLILLNFSLGLSDFLGNGSLILDDMISVLDIMYPVNYRISSRF